MIVKPSTKTCWFYKLLQRIRKHKNCSRSISRSLHKFQRVKIKRKMLDVHTYLANHFWLNALSDNVCVAWGRNANKPRSTCPKKQYSSDVAGRECILAKCIPITCFFFFFHSIVFEIFAKNQLWLNINKYTQTYVFILSMEIKIHYFR